MASHTYPPVEVGLNRDNFPASSVVWFFPIEVCEAIIDAVGAWKNGLERRYTLINCSLTCRLWLTRSRFNLYQRVYIRNRHELDLLTRTLRESHIAPYFRTHMRELFIDEGKVCAHKSSMVHLIPVVLAHTIRLVNSVRISYLNWSCFALHPSFFTMTAMFTSMVYLDLRRCNFGTLGNLTAFVTNIPSLSYLRLKACSWEGDAIPRLHRTKGPSLARLDLVRCNWGNAFERDTQSHFSVKPFREWILQTPSRTSIHTLSVEGIDPGGIPVLQNFISLLGSCLQSVRLLLYSPSGAPQPYEVDLSSAINLRCLSIKIVLLNSWQLDPEYSLKRVRSILTNVHGRKLRVLKLGLPRVDRGRPIDLHSVWQDLDTLLASAKFSQLEIAHVAYYSDWILPSFANNTAQLRTELINHLPLLHARGIISAEGQDTFMQNWERDL